MSCIVLLHLGFLKERAQRRGRWPAEKEMPRAGNVNEGSQVTVTTNKPETGASGSCTGTARPRTATTADGNSNSVNLTYVWKLGTTVVKTTVGAAARIPSTPKRGYELGAEPDGALVGIRALSSVDGALGHAGAGTGGAG